jgi:hypothetical protein
VPLRTFCGNYAGYCLGGGPVLCACFRTQLRALGGVNGSVLELADDRRPDPGGDVGLKLAGQRRLARARGGLWL